MPRMPRRNPPNPDPVVAVDAADVAPPPAPEGGAAPQTAPAVQNPQRAEPSGAPDPNLALLLEAARDPAIDVAKVERFVAMIEKNRAEAAKRAYFDAKARAKGEFPPILKTHLVDFEHRDGQGRTTYKHEDLFDITQVVDPILAKYGLSYSHRVTQTGDKIRVVCIFAHADGYSEEFPLEGLADTSGKKSPNQAVASTVTFMQRGTLKQALGLAAGRDDDGQGGDPDPMITPDDVVYVEQLIADTGSDLEKLLKTVGADRVADMRASQFKQAAWLLETVKRRLKAGSAKAADQAGDNYPDKGEAEGAADGAASAS